MDELKLSNLSPEDREILDVLVANGYDVESLASDQVERGRRLVGCLGVLNHLPVDKPGDLLIARTMEAIEHRRQQDRFSQQINVLKRSGGCGIGVRWHELATLAAVLLICVSVVWPTLSNARSRSRRVVCQERLGMAGMGFSSYAMANDGQMPAEKFRVGDSWLRPELFDDEGNAMSNTAHLIVLHRLGYVDAKALICPDAFEQLPLLKTKMHNMPNMMMISFSYQNQFTKKAQKWDRTVRLGVLADKNPLFGPGIFRRNVPFSSVSLNHCRLGGQNVLFNDSSVTWIGRPVLRGSDNMWQSGDVKTYSGTETPHDEKDSFLVW